MMLRLFILAVALVVVCSCLTNFHFARRVENNTRADRHGRGDRQFQFALTSPTIKFEFQAHTFARLRRRADILDTRRLGIHRAAPRFMHAGRFKSRSWPFLIRRM